MMIETLKSNEVLIVRSFNNLDIGDGSEFIQQLQARCSANLRKVILDFSHLKMLGSAGLRALYLLSTEAQPCQVSLIATGLLPEVREVLDERGFAALYKVVDSVEEGLAVR